MGKDDSVDMELSDVLDIRRILEGPGDGGIDRLARAIFSTPLSVCGAACRLFLLLGDATEAADKE